MQLLQILALTVIPLCILSQPQDFEALHCVACDAGFFRTQNTKACTECAEGSSTFHYMNVTSALDCLCKPGFENNTHACEMCENEFFKEVLANRSCTKCHENSQSPTLGATMHEHCKCNPGFFAVPTDGNDDRPFIVLTETKLSKRHIPVWARYSPHRTRVEKKKSTCDNALTMTSPVHW